MPEKVTKNSNGGYTVTGPRGVHAKNTTKEKAEAQQRLLNAIDHGFEPNKHGNFSSRTEATEEMQQTIQNEAMNMAEKNSSKGGVVKEGRQARGGKEESPMHERGESKAKEAKEDAKMVQGSTHGNKSGGDMGEWHGKRGKR